MSIFVIVAATCWLWALVASPGAPLPGCPLDAVVRDRLRDHQRRLVAAAVWMSMLALVALVLARPTGVDADAEAMRQAHAGPRTAPLADADDGWGCFATFVVAPICWRVQPDGSWAVEGQLDDGWWVKGEPLADGSWRVVGMVVAPGAYPSGWDAYGRRG